MASLEANLAKLKEIYLSADADPQAIGQISDWEKETQKLILQADYAKHAITERILAMQLKKVEQISFILQNDRKLSDLERATLFERRDAAQWYVNLFDPKRIQERLEEIERIVSSELADDEEENEKPA